jgi:hypothetical protein
MNWINESVLKIVQVNIIMKIILVYFVIKIA